MSNRKTSVRKNEIRENSKGKRLFEADVLALESLRLLAAPDPKDDLTDEELTAYGKKNSYPAEMIQNLIEYVKSM